MTQKAINLLYDSVNYIYLLSMLFACVCSVYRYRAVDTASRILAILICCAFANEGAAFYLTKKYHNNLPLYAFYGLLEYALLCLYFNRVIDIFIKYNLGLYIALVGVILGVLNILFVQHLNINSYFLLFEGIVVIGMSLFAFFRILLKNDSLNLYRYHHFWFISVLIFFWCITFFSWGLYNYINQKFFRSALNINIALAISSTITYSCFGCIFLLYPKMQKNNE